MISPADGLPALPSRTVHHLRIDRPGIPHQRDQARRREPVGPDPRTGAGRPHPSHPRRRPRLRRGRGDVGQVRSLRMHGHARALPEDRRPDRVAQRPGRGNRGDRDPAKPTKRGGFAMKVMIVDDHFVVRKRARRLPRAGGRSRHRGRGRIGRGRPRTLPVGAARRRPHGPATPGWNGIETNRTASRGRTRRTGSDLLDLRPRRRDQAALDGGAMGYLQKTAGAANCSTPSAASPPGSATSLRPSRPGSRD